MGTSAEIIFRKMLPEDFVAVYKIETETFIASWSHNYFKNYLKRKEILSFVAEMDKKIIAYAIVKFSAQTANIIKIAVDLQFQRRGIGKNFLLEILNFIRENGGHTINLHVRTDNTSAIRLYESVGFEILERLENFYKVTNEDAFKMECKI